MMRFWLHLTIPLAVVLASLPAGAQRQRIAALDIFDGMIHFESRQLEAAPSVNDYHCVLNEVTVRAGTDNEETARKDLYYMIPTFQLQLVDDQPVFYFDDDLLILLLESVDLTREPDAEVNGVDCYTIRTRPKDPAFRQYNRIYYVAKDDFRHIRTVASHANRDLDELRTQIDYVYDEVGGFTLVVEQTAETRDGEGNLVATTITTYTDYEFGLGLDVEFFTSYVGDKRPNPPLS